MQVDVTKTSGNVDPLVGAVIHDRFRIIAPIARGGMGAVYKAEQAPLGRLVALKILSPKHEEDQDPEFRKRFFLEAATVAKLSHPNTVTVFDYGQSDHIYFIVMELIDGITLKKAIRQAGFFAPARAIHVTKQICRSLREAHRLGVIHRDMKPGNVMLLSQGDEGDYVKVLDFGLVKDIDKDGEEEDLTQTGVFMGSPKYMSPEQIQGEPVDGRSDIYSVGVLLYEMLTGKPPFVREKQVQILMDHINAPVPDLVPLDGPPIPQEIQQVVLKCLAKRREERFDDMDQLLIALKMVAGELALPLPPSSELRMSGEFTLNGTPVSGIHTLSAELLRQSSGSLRAPTVTSSSAPEPTPSSVSGYVPSPHSTSQALGSDAPGGKMVMGLGAVAVLAALAIVFFVLDPFGAPAGDATEAPTEVEATSERAAETVVSTTGQPETTPSEELPVVAPDEPDEAPPVQPEIVSVLLELDSRPSGATVRLGEQEYGPTPLQVELSGAVAEPGNELTFLFTLAGHRDTTVVRAVPRDGQLEVMARMRRVWQPPRTGSEGGGESTGPVTPAGYRESPY